jgi:hypothetical protein
VELTLTSYSPTLDLEYDKVGFTLQSYKSPVNEVRGYIRFNRDKTTYPPGSKEYFIIKGNGIYKMATTPFRGGYGNVVTFGDPIGEFNNLNDIVNIIEKYNGASNLESKEHDNPNI